MSWLVSVTSSAQLLHIRPMSKNRAASDCSAEWTGSIAVRHVSIDAPTTRGFKCKDEEHDKLRHMKKVVQTAQDRVWAERSSRDLIRHGLTLEAFRRARQLHYHIALSGSG
jgi:hypothetical protein